MIKKIIWITLILFAVSLLSIAIIPLFSQEFTVLQLPDDLAERAKNIDIAQRNLNDQKEQLKYDITRRVIEAPQSQNEGCIVNRMVVKIGWGCSEFVFSNDFRFIMPAKNLTTASYGTSFYKLEKDGTITTVKEPDLSADIIER